MVAEGVGISLLACSFGLPVASARRAEADASETVSRSSNQMASAAWQRVVETRLRSALGRTGLACTHFSGVSAQVVGCDEAARVNATS